MRKGSAGARVRGHRPPVRRGLPLWPPPQPTPRWTGWNLTLPLAPASRLMIADTSPPTRPATARAISRCRRRMHVLVRIPHFDQDPRRPGRDLGVPPRFDPWSVRGAEIVVGHAGRPGGSDRRRPHHRSPSGHLRHGAVRAHRGGAAHPVWPDGGATLRAICSRPVAGQQTIAPAWPLDRRPCRPEQRAGVFAAGDVRSRSVKRVAAAVGEDALPRPILAVTLWVEGRVRASSPKECLTLSRRSCRGPRPANIHDGSVGDDHENVGEIDGSATCSGPPTVARAPAARHRRR